MLFPLPEKPISHPYNTTGKITDLYILIFKFPDQNVKHKTKIKTAAKQSLGTSQERYRKKNA
jgi:hypothetical protein